MNLEDGSTKMVDLRQCIVVLSTYRDQQEDRIYKTELNNVIGWLEAKFAEQQQSIPSDICKIINDNIKSMT